MSAFTGLAVYAIERGEALRERAQMGETARAVSSALERRGASSSAYLRAGAAVLTTSQDIPSEVFSRFVEQLHIDRGYNGAGGIGWAPYLANAAVPAFERAMRDRGETAFTVKPAPAATRPAAVPVAILLPRNERNLLAIGYDMYSEPTRREAMDEAAQRNRPTASGKIVLVQEGGDDAPGFLIYMPVFDGIGAARHLKGFVYSPFNAQDFLDSALQLEARGKMGIRLYDGGVAPANLLANVAPAIATGDTLTEPVIVANRPMTLVVESARGAMLSLLSMVTLLFGLLVAVLLLVVARLLTRQAQEDKAAIELMEQQNSIRDSLTRELNHRVKNTLANVLSIVSLTRRRSNSLDEFAEGLSGRIRALSATHDLLTRSEWGTTPIRDVLDAEMAPYEQEGENVLEFIGPDVQLAPNDALSFGLAIHELATNAAKYGALSQPGGKVQARWELVKEGLVRVDWREEGGPPVPEQRRRGFGTDLIEKIVAHELRQPVRLDFAREGVRCTLYVPIREPRPFAIRAGVAAQQDA